MGALTFKTLRPNRWNGDEFAELAFCVVAQEMQVQGLGTRMMNQLKALLVGERVFRVLTYADNFAIGFFRQHGFSRPVTLPQDEWKGRIAEYEGGQMMEAILHATTPTPRRSPPTSRGTTSRPSSSRARCARRSRSARLPTSSPTTTTTTTTRN